MGSVAGARPGEPTEKREDEDVMQDAGSFKLEWTQHETGTRIVSCRELPDYKVAVGPGQDFEERVGSSLRQYLAWRYGVNADLVHEANVAHFRCRI